MKTTRTSNIDFFFSNLRFNLRPINEGTMIPTFVGHMIRGVVLGLIREANPELSAKIHDKNKIRPYGVSNIFFPLEKKPQMKNGKWCLQPTHQMAFNFKTINLQLTQALIQSLLTKAGETITLANEQFILESIQLHSESVTDSLLQENISKEIFYVKFISPTQFTPRKLPGVYLFPEPRFLFGNLAHLSSDLKITKEPFNIEEFQEYVATNIYARNYELKTRKIAMGKLPTLIGFTGWVEYINKNPESNYSLMIPLLLKMGEILNVGKKRTAGMGVMKAKFLQQRDFNPLS